MTPHSARRHLLPLLIPFLLAAPAQASICHGRPGAGSIAGAVPLPARGANFEAYSQLGVQMGRTHVHARVREVLLDAYAALAEHLYALKRAAQERRVGIALVIFDPALMPVLLKTARGKELQGLPFMKGKPWIRHDEHYHVDFALPCQPAKAKAKAG